MNEKDKILADNLTRVTEATRFADAKVGIIGTICAIFIGLSKNLIDSYLDVLTNPAILNRTQRLIIPSIALTALLYFLIRTMFFIMRTLKATMHDEVFNPLFFGHIAQKSYKEYLAIIQERRLAQLKTDIATQIYVNAVIATKKYRYANLAITSVAIATVCMAAAALSLSIAGQV